MSDRVAVVSCRGQRLHVTLDDGSQLNVPVSPFPKLASATAQQRAVTRIVGRGVSIHWPEIDEDLSVQRLLDEAVHQDVSAIVAELALYGIVTRGVQLLLRVGRGRVYRAVLLGRKPVHLRRSPGLRAVLTQGTYGAVYVVLGTGPPAHFPAEACDDAFSNAPAMLLRAMRH